MKGFYWNEKGIEGGGVEKDDKAPENAVDLIKMPGQDSIETVGNHLYFYSEVDQEKILSFVKKLRELDNQMVSQSVMMGEESLPIYLHINSFGGEIFAGFAAMDAIRGCVSPVVTQIDGCCASAGTFLSLAGDYKTMTSHSYVLIHQLRNAYWGTYSDFADEMENLTKFMKMIKEIYKSRTKMPVKKIDEILKREMWLSAEEALEFGLIDSIV